MLIVCVSTGQVFSIGGCRIQRRRRSGSVAEIVASGALMAQPRRRRSGYIGGGYNSAALRSELASVYLRTD